MSEKSKSGVACGLLLVVAMIIVFGFVSYYPIYGAGDLGLFTMIGARQLAAAGIWMLCALTWLCFFGALKRLSKVN